MANRQTLKTHLIRINVGAEPDTFCQLDSATCDQYQHQVEGGELNAPMLAHAIQDVAEIFSFANVDEPVMQELQRLCVLRRAHKLKTSAR
ncbi:MAG: hypothetical protein Q8K12_04955 [Thiobacillus sp.]|nr:hypothetical protein [Thiobacillus sp.]